ncbi:hypothetical protein SAMN05421788_101536 [Filimonas lacunae]|uniref:Uncharacterized protein n=1 Tax=Filimonas lacunae TaxID=477680 RepID=A0A173MNP5_9BACT|nr:hypothetical protein [Filimonas lacunae]BAV09089.1 hypothetical protein FLA_5137 [Filimonas lacunae]SIS67142.1 hypothetical protein SAMN05421788_101536 [Filimonas lacunae]
MMCLLPVMVAAQRRLPLSSGKPREIEEFKVVGKEVWALTSNSVLVRYCYQEEGQHQSQIMDSLVTTLAVDRSNRVITTMRDKSIKRWMSEKNAWEVIGHSMDYAYGLAFDKHNNMYAITQHGVEAMLSHRRYFTDSSLNTNRGIVAIDGGWLAPATLLVADISDKSQLWMGYYLGEFGGDLRVFDLDEKKFIPVFADSMEFAMDGVRALVQMGDAVYSVHTLEHMSSLRAALCRMNNYKATVLCYYNKKYRDDEEDYGKIDTANAMRGLSAACFNPFDSCMYACSASGIFAIKAGEQISCLENWRKVYNPLSLDVTDKDIVMMDYKKVAALGPGKLLITDGGDKFHVLSDGKIREW